MRFTFNKWTYNNKLLNKLLKLKNKKIFIIFSFLFIIFSLSIVQIYLTPDSNAQKLFKNNSTNSPVLFHVQDVIPPVLDEWNRTWHDNQRTFGTDVVVDNNNNIYLAGYTTNTTPGASDAFLLKYDSFGNLLWNKTWGGNNSDWAYSVAVDNNEGIYIAGYTVSFGLEYSDAFLVKYNSSGNQLWNQTWGTSNPEFCYAVAAENSSIYIAGKYNNGSIYGFFIVEFDTNGNQIWNRTYNCESLDHVNDIAADSNSIYLTGRHSPGSSMDILLMKFDVSGNSLWNRTWSSVEYEEAYSVVLDENYVYLAGMTENYSIHEDCILIKYDSLGNKVWERMWGGDEDESAYDVAVDDKNNVYIAGTTDSFDVGFNNVFLVKFNPSGGQIWNLTWGEYVPRELCNGLAVYGNDTFYLAGYNYSSGAIDDRDALLIKLVSYKPNAPNLNPISPTLNHHGVIDLNWSEIDTAIGYYVYRDTSNITSVAGLTPITRVSTNHYQDMVSINNTYYYIVVAENDEGNSSISNCEDVIVEIILLTSAPTLNPISPNPNFDRIVKLTWNDVNGTYIYYIYRDTSPITSIVGLSPLATAFMHLYFDTAMMNGTYYYVVVAGNAGGNTSISNCESVLVIILLPQLEWEHRWGLGDDDDGTGVALDTNNNIYITGYTNSFGDGSNDIILVKYDTAGNQLWNRTWGGAGSDYAYDITIDQNNFICIVGSTQNLNEEHLDLILLKYDSDGNLLFNYTWGTPYDDYGYGVAVDSNNNIYIAVTTGVLGIFQVGNPDAVLIKLNPAGNFLWLQTWDGPTEVRGESVVVDYNDNIYLSGHLYNTLYENQSTLLAKYSPSGLLMWNRTCYGSGKSIAVDIFNNIYLANANGQNRSIYKYNSDGGLIWNTTIYTASVYWAFYEIEVKNSVIYLIFKPINLFPSSTSLSTYDLAGNPLWSFSWSEMYGNCVEGICVDTNNNSYLIGNTQFIFGPSTSDVLLVKVNSTGDQQWNLTWGRIGGDDDTILSMTMDRDDNLNLAGYTDSIGAGDYDAVIIQFDLHGNQLWNHTWGGPLEDRGSDIAIDSNQSIYLVGKTESFGIGNFDAFIVKYDSLGNQMWNHTWGGANNDNFYGITVDDQDNIYLTGSSDGSSLIVRYDTSGNQIWNRTWNSSGNSCGYGVIVDHEYNVYLAGFTEGSVLLVKYNTSGSQLWNRTWNSSGDCWANNIATDGHFLYLVGGIDTGSGFLLKYDTSGSILWNKIWNHTSNEIEFNNIVLDKNNNSYIIGTESTTLFNTYTLLIKFDSDGNQPWDLNWGGEIEVIESWIVYRIIYGKDIVIDEKCGIYLTGTGGGTDSYLGKFRDISYGLSNLISVNNVRSSDIIYQNELLNIEFNITGNDNFPLYIIISISGENFEEYHQSFLLTNTSLTFNVELQYYLTTFFDHGIREVQVVMSYQGIILYSSTISIQIQIPLSKIIIIPLFIMIGAVAATGLTYQIRKVRNDKKSVLKYLKSSKNTEIPISIIAAMTDLPSQKVSRILIDQLLKNEIRGNIKNKTFYRQTKKGVLSSIKESKESSKDITAKINKQIHLLNVSLDNIEFLFSTKDIKLNNYELAKAELLYERRRLKGQLILLSKIITILPPEIYNEIAQLPISNEEKTLIIKEIAGFPEDKAELILKEYKTFLDLKPS